MKFKLKRFNNKARGLKKARKIGSFVDKDYAIMAMEAMVANYPKSNFYIYQPGTKYEKEIIAYICSDCPMYAGIMENMAPAYMQDDRNDEEIKARREAIGGPQDF